MPYICGGSHNNVRKLLAFTMLRLCKMLTITVVFPKLIMHAYLLVPDPMYLGRL